LQYKMKKYKLKLKKD